MVYIWGGEWTSSVRDLWVGLSLLNYIPIAILGPTLPQKRPSSWVKVSIPPSVDVYSGGDTAGITCLQLYLSTTISGVPGDPLGEGDWAHLYGYAYAYGCDRHDNGSMWRL